MQSLKHPYIAAALFMVLSVICVHNAFATCSPSTVGPSGICAASNGAQSPVQGQTQNSTATASTGPVTVTGGPSQASATNGPVSASGGAGGSSDAHAAALSGSTSGSQTTITSTGSPYREAANVPNLGIIIPNGCGAGVQGGASTRGGAAVAGVSWTTDECYAFILAQSFQAVGNSKSACDALNYTDVAIRLRKRGMPMADCVTPVTVQYVERQVVGTYTREQVDAIVKKMNRK